MASEHDRIDDLPDDNARTREVYARYGLAMYCAQVLEHQLGNVIVLTEIDQGRIPDRAGYDRIWDNWMAQTLGRLASATPIKELAPQVLQACREAVDLRNDLAHHFFQRHAASFFSPSGMQRMVDEADAARDAFQATDALATAAAAELQHRLGLTDEKVTQAVEELMRAAQAGEAS